MGIGNLCAVLLLSCFLERYGLPPARYDHDPARPYTVLVVPQHQIRRLCNIDEWGCAIPRRRLVVVAKELRGEMLDLILRHEKAHLNGWTH